MDYDFVQSSRFKVGNEENNSDDDDVAEFEFGKVAQPIQITLLDDVNSAESDKPAPPLVHKKKEGRDEKDHHYKKDKHRHEEHSVKDSHSEKRKKHNNHHHRHDKKEKRKDDSSSTGNLQSSTEKGSKSEKSKSQNTDKIPTFLSQCMSEYGKPSLVHIKKDCSFLLWDKYDLKKFGLTQVIVKSCGVQHGNHMDHVFTTVTYELPSEKVSRVLKMSDSISYDSVTHELTSRCNSCYTNSAILYSAIRFAMGDEKGEEKALLRRIERVADSKADGRHYMRQLQRLVDPETK